MSDDLAIKGSSDVDESFHNKNRISRWVSFTRKWISAIIYAGLIAAICGYIGLTVRNIISEQFRLYLTHDVTIHGLRVMMNRTYVSSAEFDIQGKYALIGLNDTDMEYFLRYDTEYASVMTKLNYLNGLFASSKSVAEDIQIPPILVGALTQTVFPISTSTLLFLCVMIFMVFFIIGFVNASKSASELNLSKDNFCLVTKCSTKFDDVAGISEAKQNIAEVVDMIKNRYRYVKLGARVPKGILLTGNPGCGKTLLAKAVAGESGVPFISSNGGEFDEKFVGVGASRIKRMFELAKTMATRHGACIIFIDEIDALGRSRTASDHKYTDTLNVLLSELDGMHTDSKVMVMAASNIGAKLDSALTRSGRFDHKIHIDLPNKDDRIELFKLYLSKLKIMNTETDDSEPKDADKDGNAEDTDKDGKAEDTDKDAIPTTDAINQLREEISNSLAKVCVGMTGADIENVCNQAAINSAKADKKIVDMPDLMEAIEIVGIGHKKKSHQANDNDLRIVAHHESGHALVGLLLQSAESPIKMTIIPRGDSLGYTMPDLSESKLQSRLEIVSKIMALLGGRMAEQVIFGSITTGASNDLQKVRQYAMQYFTSGMSEYYANVYLDDDYDKLPELTKATIEKLISKLIDELSDHTEDMLIKHKEKLKSMAESLLERETIDFTRYYNVEQSDDQEDWDGQFIDKIIRHKDSVILKPASKVDKYNLELCES